MSSVEYLREFVNERLTAAAEEIFRVFIKTVVEYEEEIDRQRRLLDTVLKPEITLNRIELPQQHVCKQQEVLAEQQLCIQERNSSLDQEDPEPPQIKEEEEEPCISQEGEQLALKQETDVFSWSPTDEESDHSEDQTHFGISETQTEVAEKPQSYVSVESSAVPEPNNDHQLLPEPEQQNQHHKSNSHTHSVFNPTMSRRCNTQTGSRSFKCDTCGYTFRSKSAFAIHLTTHTGEKPYLCKACGKRFNRKADLKIHITIHTGEKPFHCNTCGKNFRRSNQLIVHTRTHTGEKPYLCNTCGKRFTQTSVLNLHRRIHTGEKPYLCTTCGKYFRYNGDLKSHMRHHTGERPYLCETCGKGFYSASYLAKHMNNDHQLLYQDSESRDHKEDKHGDPGPTRDVESEQQSQHHNSNSHTNSVFNPTMSNYCNTLTVVKSFTCDTCGKAFKYKSEFERHLMIHTGERPYVCQTCGKDFRYSGHLIVHMRTHTVVGNGTLQDLQEKIL